ncbi:hypothetical protein [Citrobacter freundii]|uniref:hypothetical protein n=1 Tax=Citrobacter freundii TaxID=546 RepID=UPI001F323D1A|nr:hypothetical protein [Citrobacter freundii]
MNATEKDNVFYCDCGFSWRRGMSGSHNCEDGLRAKLTDMAVQLANAESKCRELAAENAGLKELIEQHANSVAVCPNCSHEEPSETDDIVALYRSMETPDTDAFLVEVRAQGVEMFAKNLESMQCHIEAKWAHSFISEVLSVKNS